MTGHKASDRLARPLLPYLVRDHDDAEDPDHEAEWWFRAAPPKVVLEALKLVLRGAFAYSAQPSVQPSETVTAT